MKKRSSKNRRCTVVDCGRKHFGKGYCAHHYNQLPEVKERVRNYYRTPTQKARKAAYYRRPAVRAKALAYGKSPAKKAYDLRRQKTIHGLFLKQKSFAKFHNKEWTLSKEDFASLRQQVCTYCQGPLPELGVGLDRLDNRRGYTLANVVPCCTDCNLVRGDRLTHLEMLHDIGPVLRKVKLARKKPLAYTPEVSPTLEVPHGDR